MLTVLRCERLKRGLTVKQFSERYNLSRTRLSRLETGREYIPPSWRTKLSDALGVPVESFCDEAGFPKVVED